MRNEHRSRTLRLLRKKRPDRMGAISVASKGLDLHSLTMWHGLNRLIREQRRYLPSVVLRGSEGPSDPGGLPCDLETIVAIAELGVQDLVERYRT